MYALMVYGTSIIIRDDIYDHIVLAECLCMYMYIIMYACSTMYWYMYIVHTCIIHIIGCVFESYNYCQHTRNSFISVVFP